MILKGKTAVITGANRGVGRAILEKFAMYGCDRIYACVRCPRDSFDTIIEELNNKYDIEIKPVYFDLLDEEALKDSARWITKDADKVDILVNNAGIASGSLFQMTSMKEIRRIFDANFFSQLFLTQLLSRKMSRTGNSAIVNIASTAGIDLASGNCAYGASKATVIAETKVLAADLAQYGIRANAVAPGVVDTDMAAQMKKDAYEEMIQQSLLNRPARADEIAEVVAFLASDRSSFVNGQVIRVDGGRK